MAQVADIDAAVKAAIIRQDDPDAQRAAEALQQARQPCSDERQPSVIALEAGVDGLTTEKTWRRKRAQGLVCLVAFVLSLAIMCVVFTLYHLGLIARPNPTVRANTTMARDETAGILTFLGA
eukprot:scaffold268812_cov31-Prasinocladus_malaysianus.AAC.1